jgi:hypothetical protein
LVWVNHFFCFIHRGQTVFLQGVRELHTMHMMVFGRPFVSFLFNFTLIFHVCVCVCSSSACMYLCFHYAYVWRMYFEIYNRLNNYITWPNVCVLRVFKKISDPLDLRYDVAHHITL